MAPQQVCRWLLVSCGGILVVGSLAGDRIETYRQRKAIEYADRRILEANSAEGAGRLREACELLESAVRKAPAHYAAWVAYANLGATYQERGDVDTALAIYHKAMKRIPKNPSPYINIGIIYYGRKAYATAAAFFERAIGLEPGNLDGHLGLAQCLEMVGKNREAARALSVPIGKGVTSASAYQVLGRNLRLSGELDAAVEAYRLAMELGSNDPDLRNSFAVASIENGDPGQAGAVLEPLVEEHPGRLDYRLNLSIALQGQHRLSEALDQCVRVIGVDSARAEAHALLGGIQAQMGDVKAAAASYGRALALDPADSSSRAMLDDLTGDSAGGR